LTGRAAARLTLAFPESARNGAEGTGQNTMRLNFANAIADGIEEGMARLERARSRVMEPT